MCQSVSADDGYRFEDGWAERKERLTRVVELGEAEVLAPVALTSEVGGGRYRGRNVSRELLDAQKRYAPKSRSKFNFQHFLFSDFVDAVDRLNSARACTGKHDFHRET